MWTSIGDFLTSPADLVNLASISPQRQAWPAAPWSWCSVLRFHPFQRPLKVLEIAISGKYFYEVGHGKSMVVRGGHQINVELGQYSEWSADCRHEMTIEV